MTHDLTAADLEVLRSARAKCTTMEMFNVLEVVDKLLVHVPLRRCVRCGERVRVEGETVLCDGVVSKLAPLSVHEPVSTEAEVFNREQLVLLRRLQREKL